MGCTGGQHNVGVVIVRQNEKTPRMKFVMCTNSSIGAISVDNNQFSYRKSCFPLTNFHAHYNATRSKGGANVQIITYFCVGKLMKWRRLVTNWSHRIHRITLTHGRHELTEKFHQSYSKLRYELFENMIV